MSNLATIPTALTTTGVVVHGCYQGPHPTPEQAAVVLPCLPGCTQNHANTVGQCFVATDLGAVRVSYGEPEVTVRAISTTEGALRLAEVELNTTGDPTSDCAQYLDPAEARRLGMLLIQAANAAESIAAR